jgi:hypothetical protein
VSKKPDRSYLADAIHLVDLIHRAGEEVPPAIAAVEQSKAAAITAQLELEKHQQWLDRHQELYVQAVDRLKRLAYGRWMRAKFNNRIQALARPTRPWLSLQLQNRIQALDRARQPLDRSR